MKYFIFGSYLKNHIFNDIDILIVVPTNSDIDKALIFTEELNKKNPENIIHVQIYTYREYDNPENKFSYTKVNHEISKNEFLELYKKCPTN